MAAPFPRTLHEQDHTALPDELCQSLVQWHGGVDPQLRRQVTLSIFLHLLQDVQSADQLALHVQL